MAAWAGFSEEELRKVKKLSIKNSDDIVNRSNSAARTPHNQHMLDERPKKIFNKKPPSHKIAKEPVAKYTIVETPLKSVDIKMEPLELEDDKQIAEELDKEAAMNRELKSLERFREQQQAIEEANKQKKALVSRTLTERKHRAKKEAHKLEHIQKELSRLDNLLTRDVQVIRVKIEDASREFLDAQKRFEKAETEYVQAKISLHDKTELKEQLTEHLYTIIHQNEVRKAKKLADLMKELEMENGENDDLELPELPPLTTFQPPQMLLSPTGSKSLPGLSKFKIVEDNRIPTVEKPPSPVVEGSPAVDSEQELCDKKSEMMIIEASVRSLKEDTNDGKEKLKEKSKEQQCDKTGDNSKDEKERPSVNNSNIKLDGTRAGSDEKEILTVNNADLKHEIDDNDTSGSNDSKEVSMDTAKSEVDQTGDNCSGSEPISESSVSEQKQKNDSNDNTANNVKVKTKWEFDGTLT